MLFLPAAIGNPFLIANIFTAIQDKINKALDNILVNVIQGVAGAVYDAASRGIETLTNLFVSPMGMNVTTFNKIIPSARIFYNIILWFGVIVSTLLLFWLLFRTLVLKAEGEHPVKLIMRYALTIGLMFASTTIFDTALGIANIPYQALSTTQYEYDQESGSNFLTDIMNKLFGSRTQEDYNDLGSSAQIDGSALVSKSEDIFDAVMNDFVEVLDDDGNIITDREERDEKLSGSLGYLLISLVLSLAFILFIFINYIKLLVECIERYVVLGVLYYTSPLPLAAGISEETRQIRGSWIRMCISQILILFFSMWFLRGFTWAYGNAAAEIVKAPQYTVFYLGMVLAFLKVGQHVDEYMGILGMSSAKTGRGLLEDMAIISPAIRSAGNAIRKGISGASKGGRDNTPDASSVYNPIDPRKGSGTVSGGKAANQFATFMGLGSMNLKDMRVSKGNAQATRIMPDGTKQSISWRPATQDEINGKRALSANESMITAKDGTKHIQTEHPSKESLEANKASLSGVSLNHRNDAGLDLSYGNINGVNMDGAGLPGMKLDSASVKDSTAHGADLTGASAAHSSFERFEAKEADLTGFDAPDSHIRKSDFSSADLTEANLSGSNIESTTLDNAQAQGMDLHESVLTGNHMENMNGRGMDASDTVWKDNNASGAVLADADMSFVRGENNNFSDAILENSNFRSCDLESADLSGVSGRGMSLEESIFRGNTVMHAADYHDANLENCSWEGVRGIAADFEGANLRGAAIENSSLKNSSFVGTVFDDRTSFVGTDLSGCNFTGADITGVDFTGADLTGAIMPDGYLYDINRYYGNPTIGTPGISPVAPTDQSTTINNYTTNNTETTHNAEDHSTVTHNQFAPRPKPEKMDDDDEKKKKEDENE